MFYQLNKGEDYDINGINLKNWLNTYKANLTNLALEDTGAATITNLTNLCYQFSNLQSIDFTNFNGSNITECYRMVQECSNLTNISGINFPNCNNYRATFAKCTNLNYFPIKSEEFKNDTIYRYTYENCSKITDDISNINVNNCEFSSCFIGVGSYNITNIMLTNCIINNGFSNMKNVQSITNMTLEDCTYLGGLFKACNNLTNVSNFKINLMNLPYSQQNLQQAFLRMQ